MPSGVRLRPTSTAGPSTWIVTVTTALAPFGQRGTFSEFTPSPPLYCQSKMTLGLGRQYRCDHQPTRYKQTSHPSTFLQPDARTLAGSAKSRTGAAASSSLV